MLKVEVVIFLWIHDFKKSVLSWYVIQTTNRCTAALPLDTQGLLKLRSFKFMSKPKYIDLLSNILGFGFAKAKEIR